MNKLEEYPLTERIFNIEKTIFFSILGYLALNAIKLYPDNIWISLLFIVLFIFFSALATVAFAEIASQITDHYNKRIFLFYSKYKIQINLWAPRILYVVLLFFINYEKNRPWWMIGLQVCALIILDILKNKYLFTKSKNN